MSEHRATIEWHRDGDDFAYSTYTRNHRWRFENGHVIDASATPQFLGDADRVDPEETFVASISSCHMLTFLAMAAQAKLVVDRYEDAAVGFLEKDDDGRLAVRRVELRPRVVFGGDDRPDESRLAKLHENAHHHCFIANSVRTQIDLR